MKIPEKPSRVWNYRKFEEILGKVERKFGETCSGAKNFCKIGNLPLYTWENDKILGKFFIFPLEFVDFCKISLPSVGTFTLRNTLYIIMA